MDDSWKRDRIGAALRGENRSVLGNGLPVVHGHVFPRYAWEAVDRRRGPVWLYPNSDLYGAEHELGPRHDALRRRIEATIDEFVDERARTLQPG